MMWKSTHGGSGAKLMKLTSRIYLHIQFILYVNVNVNVYLYSA